MSRRSKGVKVVVVMMREGSRAAYLTPATLGVNSAAARRLSERVRHAPS
jgi:hypothetical protein